MYTIRSAVQDFRLPKLPKRLSYWDDYAAKKRTIENIERCDIVSIMTGGFPYHCDLRKFHDAADIMRVVLSEWLLQRIEHRAQRDHTMFPVPIPPEGPDGGFCHRRPQRSGGRRSR